MRLNDINYNTFIITTLAFLTSLCATQDVHSKDLLPGNDNVHLTQAANHRIESINDAFNGSDNGVSNALSFQFHSPVSNTWQALPVFGPHFKSFAQWVPGLSGEQFHKRASISVSQLLQTPTDITNPNPIPNDVAHLGLLTISTGLSAYNDNEFRGLNIVVGVTGEASFAEQTQNFAHEVGGVGEVVQGWDHQVDIAPILNIGALYKKKFFRAGNRSRFAFDASISTEAKVGNMLTEAGLRLETRFGFNMPGGFVPIPDPIGRFMQYDARLAPQKANAASFYGSASLHAAAIAHIILIDGTIVRDNPDIAGSLVEKEPIVGFLFLGLHYERSAWAIHLQHVITTDFVEANTASASTDPENSFTSISLEWRI